MPLADFSRGELPYFYLMGLAVGRSVRQNSPHFRHRCRAFRQLLYFRYRGFGHRYVVVSHSEGV